jgi:hypothetical protein
MDTMTPLSVDKYDDRVADINPISQRWLFGPHCPCSSSDHRCAIIEVVSSAWYD